VEKCFIIYFLIKNNQKIINLDNKYMPNNNINNILNIKNNFNYIEISAKILNKLYNYFIF